MADFPKLKTGAVAQYPLTRELRVRSESVRFLDGASQRYRDARASRRRWVIRLDLLDEGEMAALEEFFLAVQGQYSTFSFADPWDGKVYENCRLADDQIALTAYAEMQGRTSVTVTQ